MPKTAQVLERPPLQMTASWTVTVGFELGAECHVHPTVYRKIESVLKGHGPALTVERSRVRIGFGVDASNADEADDTARTLTRQVAKELGVSSARVADLRVVNDSVLDAELETYASTFPECVGLGEVASILGVSKQRIYQLAERDDFPSPAFRLKATPVWLAADIRHFARNRPRRKRA